MKQVNWHEYVWENTANSMIMKHISVRATSVDESRNAYWCPGCSTFRFIKELCLA